MKLEEILKEVNFTSNKKWDEIKDIEIQDISYNSMSCAKDYIFVAIQGETTNGHKYIDKAYEKGVRVFIISEDVLLPDDGIKIFVKDSRVALSKISSNYFNNPSKDLTVIGITGTKGKTTTANYIKTVLQDAGYNTGIIGTNGIFYNNIEEATKNTTPESYEIQRILRNMVDNGVKYVTMEVSSGGLMMSRVEDIDFDIAIFTNISHDHIGPKEHPSFEHYLDCKSKLFSLAKHGIVNIDDSCANYIIENAKSTIETFSIEQPSDLQAINIKKHKSIDHLGSKFTVKRKTQNMEYEISSPGIFNIYNSLAVISVCQYLKVEYRTIKNSLKNVSVCGRVELLPILDYATVIVDFAHNGVSLQSLLTTLKEYEPNRLICVIGSVGGRVIMRRKEIGDIAAEECDICILTSDNPDTEDPMNIINQMAKSFIGSSCEVIKEPDREKAIREAIRIAEKGDMVILAGKGHETYQLINGEKIYFNDKEAAVRAARDLKSGKLIRKHIEKDGKSWFRNNRVIV